MSRHMVDRLMEMDLRCSIFLSSMDVSGCRTFMLRLRCVYNSFYPVQGLDEDNALIELGTIMVRACLGPLSWPRVQKHHCRKHTKCLHWWHSNKARVKLRAAVDISDISTIGRNSVCTTTSGNLHDGT